MNHIHLPKLNFLIRQPKIKSEKPPLIIMLHGVGSNEGNMFSFADELPDDFLVVSVRGPLILGVDSYAWFQVNFTQEGPVINKQQAEDSRKEILRFIDDLKNVENFDEQQVYLVGFSQGGIMSYSAALTSPEKIKGIAVLSGRLLPEVKSLIATEEQLKNLNVFVSHGTNDRVLNFQYAIDATDYLLSKNVKVQLHKYEEDHTVNSEMLKDVITWLVQTSN